MGFEVALFNSAEDQRCENKGNYHNPTSQRGIYGDTGKSLKLNLSLTSRVVMAANLQLQDASGRDLDPGEKSLTDVSGWDFKARTHPEVNSGPFRIVVSHTKDIKVL